MQQLQSQPMLTSLALTFLWTTVILMVVSIGGAVLVFAAKSSLSALLIAALLPTMVLLTILWQRSRHRTRRHQAALDAYVARELARVALYGRNNRSGLAPIPVTGCDRD